MARAISEAEEGMRAAEASQAPLVKEREALHQERAAMWAEAQRAEADAEVGAWGMRQCNTYILVSCLAKCLLWPATGPAVCAATCRLDQAAPSAAQTL